jgi:hypothetical protein
MKHTKHIKKSIIVAIIVGFCFSQEVFADAIITNPPSGTLIENRLDFPVTGSIDEYRSDLASNLHYWITIADVGTDNKPHIHWPKFYVKSAAFRGRVSDGGQNPFPEPQDMMVILLRVDDTTNQRIIRWLKRGRQTGSYPGIPVKPAEIEAMVPIQFP